MASGPPLDLSGLRDLFIKFADNISAALDDIGVPEYIGWIIAGGIAGVLMSVPLLIAVGINGILGLGTWFAVRILGTFTNVRSQNKDDFNAVIAASLSELLGTDISFNNLPGGNDTADIGARMAALGGAVHNTLRNELGVDGEITNAQGEENARKFTGFGVNFATSTAFIAILTEACSIGQLKEFRELGVATAEALGLGRLQRIALKPLMDCYIAKPYLRSLQAQLRPNRISEAQVVRALRAGQIDAGDAHDALAELGYRDADIDLLITDLTAKIAASELYTLVRYGDLTLDQAVQQLSDAGMDTDNAKLALKALGEAKADTLVSGILSDLEGAYTDGFISQDLYNATIDKLPISDDEAEMFRMKVGLHQERPRKRISFAQLQKGVVQGIVDFDYVGVWLNSEGYSMEDQQVLTYEILEALKTSEDKVKFAEWRAAQLRLKGKPVPPWLQI